MGLADCLIKMGIKYGSPDALDFCEDLALDMAQVAVTTSLNLAKRDGAFPECISELVAKSDFIKALDLNETIMDEIKEHGLRNCALLTIAPTGTLSTMIGVSGGIEPIFSNSYTRKTESLNGSTQPVYYKVYTPIVKQYMEEHEIENEEDLPNYFVTAHDIFWRDRVNM
jgi:ribonucleoside-diphosphate reductase alpha chain